MAGAKSLIVLGAGGHGKSVISIARTAGYVVEAVTDDDPALWGKELLGVPVVPPDAPLCREEGRLAIIGVGDNRKRKEIAQRFSHFEWATIIYPGSYTNPSGEIGPGTIVLPWAVLGAESHVGAHVIVSAQCTVGHDTVIGDFAHLAPGVHVAGDVVIGEGVFMGISSAVVPAVHIGEWTVVGAGGVVVRDLPARCKAMGLPARPVG
jgi:sugar O-acyltransferase (sialic acid O-acetyltransferase NeuD family)